MSDYEVWKNAKCPDDMDEWTFNHLWFGYGIRHNYFIVHKQNLSSQSATSN